MKLKPCPFCGGKAIIAKITYGEVNTFYSVTCDNWRCAVATVVPNYSDKEEAIEAWNRRAQPGEIDRLALVIAAEDEEIIDVDGLLERFLKTRQQIASDLFADSKSDRSLTYTKYDIARRIKSVINWQKWKLLFPLLKDYWN